MSAENYDDLVFTHVLSDMSLKPDDATPEQLRARKKSIMNVVARTSHNFALMTTTDGGDHGLC